MSPELKSVNVDIIEDDYCMNLQDHSPKEMICAGAKGEGKLQYCQYFIVYEYNRTINRFEVA